MRRSHILEAWNEFESTVLPIECGELQRTETRRAFFAGCAAMFHFVTGSPLIIGKSNKEGSAVLHEIEIEILAYVDSLRKGTA